MPDSTRDVARRTVLAGAGLAAGLALPGCVSYGNGTAPAAAPTAAPAAAPSGTAAAAGLAKTSDIPVGGGTIFAAQKLVITQPVAGTFAAFDTTCPHQGCSVSTVSAGTINCPCHGSMFRIADGSVAGGPAPRPLTRHDITVAGDVITSA